MEVVEEEVNSGRIEGVELFFLTKHSMVGDVYYWGNSGNNELF